MVDKQDDLDITSQVKELIKKEKFLEAFYLALSSENADILKHIHIPRSDVFYVREAIELNTGVRYSLEHVEWAMKKENMLNE